VRIGGLEQVLLYIRPSWFDTFIVGTPKTYSKIYEKVRGGEPVVEIFLRRNTAGKKTDRACPYVEPLGSIVIS
jgi:hypothetical protein